MKWIMAFAAITLALISVTRSQTPSNQTDNGVLSEASEEKNLYPADADAQKETKAALQHASESHKRVLLVFGGNWCYDCHVLDKALHEGEAGRIMSEGFVLVHVDIGEADKNLDLTKKYNIPLDKGVPAVAVLKSDGKLVYSSGGGEFEAARTMMRKDLVAFLKRWQEEK